MRIAIVSLNLAQRNGDTRNVFSLALALQSQGHELSMYTTEYSPSIFPDIQREIKNINVIHPPVSANSLPEYESLAGKTLNRIKRISMERGAVKAIRDHLRTDLDLLICGNDYSYSLGKWYKRKNPRTKVAWFVHNTPYFRTLKKGCMYDLFSRCASLFEWLRVKRYMSGIDLIIVNDVEHKKLTGKLGVPVILLRIPVDFERFYQTVRPRPKNKNEVTVLGIGSLSPARNFEDIIIAGALLKEKGYHSKIILICKDFWKDESYKKFLLRLAKEKGMEESVEFWFKGASEEELKEVESLADIFVVATHINAWSMSVSEAMVAGLPVVLSKTCSNCEILKDGVNALFFESGDTKELADKVDSLVRNPEFYEHIACSGQEFVKDNLTIGKYLKDFLSAIDINRQIKDVDDGSSGPDGVSHPQRRGNS